MDYLGWLLVGLLIGVGITFFVMRLRKTGGDGRDPVASLLRSHFHPIPTDDITISEREFPFRVRADLQRAIDRLFSDEIRVLHFCGVRKEYSHEGLSLSDYIIES